MAKSMACVYKSRNIERGTLSRSLLPQTLFLSQQVGLKFPVLKNCWETGPLLWVHGQAEGWLGYLVPTLGEKM